MALHQFVEQPPIATPAAPVKTQVKPNIMNTSKQVAESVKTETVPTPEAPKTTKSEEKLETPKVSSSDILGRSSTKTELPKAEETPQEEIQTQSELDKITDPAQRAIIDKKIKDLESGYNKKYHTLAQQRKEVEDLKFKLSNWTPQRLAEELRKPEFIQSMQSLQQQAPPQEWNGSAEEWSALSDSDKQQMNQMRREHQSLQSQLAQMKQKEEDVEIKKVYPDFEPQVVDDAIEGLRTGQITASRADIWKVVNHDKNVEKGYQFGYEDGYKKALEKLNGSTHLNGNLNVIPADEVPEDVRKGGFSSIAMWRLGRSKNGAQNKR